MKTIVFDPFSMEIFTYFDPFSKTFKAIFDPFSIKKYPRLKLGYLKPVNA